MAKIHKQLMHELVSQEIQKYIEEKELQEGEKLPSVEEMTRMFGVGRSSLREALRHLETIEIVNVVNGKGIFVRDVGTYRFAGKVKVENEKRFLLSILDVRRALEGKAVELAARRITPAQVAELAEILREYDKLREADLDTSKIDLAFHRSVMRAASNPILFSVLESISGMYEKFFNEPLGDKRLFDETYPYHRSMFEGIAARDPKKALSEFDKMMNRIEEIIKTY